MELQIDVFVEAHFQWRLLNCSEYYQAEFLLFTELLEAYGFALLNTPGYCIKVPVEDAEDERTHVWVKLIGCWTPLWIEGREPGVLVVYDR